MQTASQVDQHYWRDPRLPFLELRTTAVSRVGYGRHAHACVSLGILTEGATCAELDQQIYQLEAGDAVLIEPHQPHACNPLHGGARGYAMLYLDTQWCFQQLGYANFHCVMPVLRQDQACRQIVRWLTQLQQAFDNTVAAQLQQVLVSLLRRCCQPAGRVVTQPAWAQHILADLQQPPSLPQLAQALHCSRETVIRKVQQHSGLTPRVWLNNQRVEAARQLLRQGSSIVTTAQQVGFADQSQFHHSFVKFTASTPRQYQRALPFSDNKS